MLIRLNQ